MSQVQLRRERGHCVRSHEVERNWLVRRRIASTKLERDKNGGEQGPGRTRKTSALKHSWRKEYRSDLGKIVRGATKAFDNPDVPKFTIEEPDVRMTSGAVIAIAMTLNELCTNTTKFGALSVPAGRVDIGWTLDPETQRLQMKGTEKNGPAVRAPDKRSFGTPLGRNARQATKGRRPFGV
jgi:hypothetical protein